MQNSDRELTTTEATFRRMKARIAALETALEPFAIYAEKRQAMPVLGLGDSIHTIHGGTEWEGEVKFSHCLAAMKALRR